MPGRGPHDQADDGDLAGELGQGLEVAGSASARRSVTRCPAPSSMKTRGTRSWRRAGTGDNACPPRRADRTAQHGDVLGPGEHRPAVDAPRTGDERVPRAGGSSVVPTSCPISENEAGSKRVAIRSRALRRPRSFWRVRRASPPMPKVSAFRRSISSRAGLHPESSSPTVDPPVRRDHVRPHRGRAGSSWLPVHTKAPSTVTPAVTIAARSGARPGPRCRVGAAGRP